MDTFIVFVYCLCDDLLKGLGHWEDLQCEVGDAEVLTTALVAARYFGGNFTQAQALLSEKEHRKCDAPRVAGGPDVLSKSAAPSQAETKHKATEPA